MSRVQRFLFGVVIVVVIAGFLSWPGLKETIAERVAQNKIEQAAQLVEKQAEIDLKNKKLMAVLPANCTIKFLGEFYTVEGYSFPTTMVQCSGSMVTTTTSIERCGKSTCYRNVVSTAED